MLISKLRALRYRTGGTLQKLRRRLTIRRTAPPVGCISTKEFASSHSNVTYQVKREAYTVHREPPATLDSEPHWRFAMKYDYHFAEAFTAVIPQGRVFGEGVAITPDNYILRDVSSTIGWDSNDHPLCHSDFLPHSQYRDMDIAVLVSRGGDNYYHWMFEILPRLIYLENREVDAYYVNYGKSFQREYLQMIGIPEEKVIPARQDLHIRARNLVVPSLPSLAGNPTEDSCRFLRKQLGNADLSNIEHSAPRLYVTRSDARFRKVINEPEVLEVMRDFGFEAVSLTGLSVRRQMSLFSRAEIIVGPHGAGLSNLVYVPEGTKVLELFAPTYINVCFWQLAPILQLRYFYLLGEGTTYTPQDYPHTGPTDILVPIDDLARMLSIIVG